MHALDRTRAIALTMTAALLLTGASLPLASADVPLGLADGYTLMVHGHVEPDAPVQLLPPVEESLLTTQEDGVIRLHLIPFATETEAPAILESPRLTVTSTQDGSGATFVPNGDPTASATCEAETTLEGHEGPIEACLVFEIPVDAFPGDGMVSLRLTFSEDGAWRSMAYSSVAHGLLHAAMESDGAVTFEQADAAGAVSTPFLVFEHADPA